MLCARACNCCVRVCVFVRVVVWFVCCVCLECFVMYYMRVCSVCACVLCECLCVV